MSEINEKIKKFTDEFLIEQYRYKQEEYTTEAILMIKEEMVNRNLDLHTNDTSDKNRPNEINEHDNVITEDFVPFDHGFYKSDLVLAQAIMEENKIPFYGDASMSSDVIPLKSEAERYYTIHVPPALLEKARLCIDEHFKTSDGMFSVKLSGIKERLKSINFYELNSSDIDINGKIDVQFSPQESSALWTYAIKLQTEADTIEKEQDKILFYFDNLEECADHLSANSGSSYTISDLLTILEVLQVYCEDVNFPKILEDTSKSLLTFFE